MPTMILIPAKDEAETIFQVVEEIKDRGFDVAVIDDGSIDETARLAEQAGALVLKHLINRGQGAALKTGIEYALNRDYDPIVFFDADGQMTAEEIQKLTASLGENFEVALGSRFLGRAENIPRLKFITLKLALLFSRFITGLKLSDVHNGFQAWRADALKKINLVQDRQAYASEILEEIADKKLNYIEAPVTIRYTEYSKRKGQSVFNAFKIVWDLMVKR